MTIQPQFDLVAAAAIGGAVITTAFHNLHKVMPLCYNEGVDPNVIGPMERLGRWLMVDPKRLADGEKLLTSLPPPKLFRLSTLSILIGLDTNPTASLVKTISRHNSLIAASLFFQACGPCFMSAEAGRLAHELMRLSGILKDHPIPSHLVHQFHQAMNGLSQHQVPTRESFTDVYNSLSREILHCDPRSLATVLRREAISSLEIDVLANVIYKTIGGLENEEVDMVVLEGSYQGLWLASLFVWLRPDEVEVFFGDTRLYSPIPTVLSQRIRLRVQLREAQDEKNRWFVKLWRATNEGLPLESWRTWRSGASSGAHSSVRGPTPSMRGAPLGSARLMVRTTSGKDRAMGQFAAALVNLATEHGTISADDGTRSMPLQDICSREFLNTYPTIMKLFGWDDLTQDALPEQTSATLLTVIRQTPDFSFLSNALFELKTNTGLEYTSDFDDAIHLAAEALLLALCHSLPPNLLYRPFEPYSRQRSAELLYAILSPQGFPYWEFRKLSVARLIPEADGLEPSDLAVSSNGLAAYTGALAQWGGGSLTSPRDLAAIHISGGPMKTPNLSGELSRLTEWVNLGSNVTRYTTGSVPPHASDPAYSLVQPVELFRAERCVLDDHNAKDKLGAKVVHLWSIDSAASRPRMLVAAYAEFLHDGRQERLPRSWKNSIKAIIFATHIEDTLLRPAQLRALATQWESDYQLSRGLDWAPLGFPKSYMEPRFITQTAYNEQLRFLEAGEFSFWLPGRESDKKLFVRHGNTPLIACIKLAMETCEAQPWIILS